MPKIKTGLQKMNCMMIGFLLFSCAAFAQRTVTGKVISKTDQKPIANATVMVRGTVIATTTDSSGAFSITVPKNNNELEITSIGFENMQLSVAGKTDIGDIQLAVTAGDTKEGCVCGTTFP